jgi:ABC-type sugar transport system substrate-binding protein
MFGEVASYGQLTAIQSGIAQSINALFCVILSVTKLRPGLQTITLASVIRMALFISSGRI